MLIANKTNFKINCKYTIMYVLTDFENVKIYFKFFAIRKLPDF